MLVITQHLGATATGTPGTYTTGGPRSRCSTGVSSTTGVVSVWVVFFDGVFSARGVVSVTGVVSTGGVDSVIGVVSLNGVGVLSLRATSRTGVSTPSHSAVNGCAVASST